MSSQKNQFDDRITKEKFLRLGYTMHSWLLDEAVVDDLCQRIRNIVHGSMAHCFVDRLKVLSTCYSELNRGGRINVEHVDDLWRYLLAVRKLQEIIPDSEKIIREFKISYE